MITTDEPRRYRGRTLDPIATVRHRDEFAAVERELAAVAGVTVLIHDDRCATEERRLRKRGKLPTVDRAGRDQRAGVRGLRRLRRGLDVPVRAAGGHRVRPQDPHPPGLLQLRPELPEGRLPVVPAGRAGPGAASRRCPSCPVALVEPVSRLTGDDTLVRMPGIGGTGVVTTSQILQMAAHLDGGHAAGLEQTGLAQKGGPVVSDLRFSAKPLTGALRASRGRADVVLGFDLLGAAADPTLQVAERGPDVAVLDTAIVPTAEMVTGRIALPGSPAEALAPRRVRDRPGREPLPGRPGPGPAAVRRPHAGQHAAGRRGLPARLPADGRGRDRAGHRAERGRGGHQPGRVPLGPGRRARPGRGGRGDRPGRAGRRCRSTEAALKHRPLGRA